MPLPVRSPLKAAFPLTVSSNNSKCQNRRGYLKAPAAVFLNVVFTGMQIYYILYIKIGFVIMKKMLGKEGI